MIFKNIFLLKGGNITFIFGCPRGGTTWLWSLLESHPDVVPFLDNRNTAKNKYSTSESGVYIAKPREARKLIIGFSKNYRGKRIIEKTPSHTLIYSKIIKDFPGSKNIVILRNPLAIANSMIHSNMTAFESYDLEKSIREIKEYYKNLEKLCSTSSNLCITYEQLLADPEKVLSSVFKYLNLNDSNLKGIVQENHGSTKVLVKGAFRSGIANSYLDELKEEDINILNTELYKELEFYYSKYEQFKNSCCE